MDQGQIRRAPQPHIYLLNHISIHCSTLIPSGEYCTLILIISLQLIFKAKRRCTERRCLRTTSAEEPWQPLIFSNVKKGRCPRCGNHYHGDTTCWPACQQCGTRHNPTLPACPPAQLWSVLVELAIRISTEKARCRVQGLDKKDP